ncbi:MAG: prolipoprotein diacylglyceryl transferase [Pelagimonas sp.]|uniref:prolipoprotein diacylglyceryl transferase n=1 Tax=Pelagimonas sp. TaxID=2073170 RepID=UPI003D6BC70F
MLAAIPFPPLSPELFSIDLFGFHIALRWYALAYIAGILLGWRFTVMTVKRARLWKDDQPPMTPAQIEDLLTWIILGVIIGGRLGYVLFYQPGYYLSHPTEILFIWQGGMAFHGGFLGTVVAAWIFCARNNIPKLPTADMLALAAPAGLFFGRIANFINAELWGRQTDVAWGVIFPGDHAQNCGQPLGELCARHPSQLYEAGLEGLALGLIVLLLITRGALKKPGLLAGTFFAGYGAARFFVEFFRQPDAQFQSPGNPLGLAYHIDGYGLTMGQTLTLPMIAIGIWFILRATRHAYKVAT